VRVEGLGLGFRVDRLAFNIEVRVRGLRVEGLEIGFRVEGLRIEG